MVTPNDTIIVISNSGETEEVVRLIPSIKKLGIPIIGFVGRLNSTLAKHSDMVIDVSVEKEACPNNLAPTNSTLATMAMGDALAVSLIKERNFLAQDFAKFHPGGSLGKKLLTTVADAMHSGDLPICPPDQSIHDALITITQGRLGLVLIMEGDKLLGIVTDGDLRRGLQKYDNLLNISIREIMTSNPKTICASAMIADAEEKMRNNKIKALVVLNKKDKVCGIVEIFDD
jgi:arabinose-5-phosphate isomerase